MPLNASLGRLRRAYLEVPANRATSPRCKESSPSASSLQLCRLRQIKTLKPFWPVPMTPNALENTQLPLAQEPLSQIPAACRMIRTLGRSFEEAPQPMPFFLYDVASTASGRTYQRSREIQLAGRSGPLARLQAQSNLAGDSPHKWHVTGSEIVTAIPGAVAGQEIIVDLMPNAKGTVSLYRLLDVWGYSEDSWTPVALRMQALFVESPATNPAQFKQEFSDLTAGSSFVGEFLYLRGGERRRLELGTCWLRQRRSVVARGVPVPSGRIG